MIESEYFNALYSKVCNDSFGTSYRNLLILMYDMKFYPRHSMDLDRWRDGLRLRREMTTKALYDSMPADCNILEMMLALAIGMEEQVMSDPSKGNRMSEWFWEMMASLKISHIDDSVFNTHTESEAAHKLNAFNCGWYKSNGEGGLFTFTSNINAPSIPLWDQAIRHMNDVLRITNK